MTKSGFKPLMYDADLVARGAKNLTISVSDGKKSGLEVYYDSHSLTTVAAAWFRRPDDFKLNLADKAKELRVCQEMRILQDTAWYTIPEHRWLNAPSRINMPEAWHKIIQLELAKKIGFRVPATVASNDWKPITEKLHLPLLMKMSHGVLFDGKAKKSMFATAIDKEKLGQLTDTSPFPGIFQPFISKKREWRITIVGDHVFPVAIYTDKQAKDDWRKHQETNAVVFKNESFDAEIIEKCKHMLHKLGLRFGAFDFIENDDGITFLEVNSCGQFKWLEEELRLPISEAIASELMHIARS